MNDKFTYQLLHRQLAVALFIIILTLFLKIKLKCINIICQDRHFAKYSVQLIWAIKVRLYYILDIIIP